jgi:hypothetical protein
MVARKRAEIVEVKWIDTEGHPYTKIRCVKWTAVERQRHLKEPRDDGHQGGGQNRDHDVATSKMFAARVRLEPEPRIGRQVYAALK